MLHRTLGISRDAARQAAGVITPAVRNSNKQKQLRRAPASCRTFSCSCVKLDNSGSHSPRSKAVVDNEQAGDRKSTSSAPTELLTVLEETIKVREAQARARTRLELAHFTARLDTWPTARLSLHDTMPCTSNAWILHHSQSFRLQGRFYHQSRNLSDLWRGEYLQIRANRPRCS